jgi:hypothetical protein
MPEDHVVANGLPSSIGSHAVPTLSYDRPSIASGAMPGLATAMDAHRPRHRVRSRRGGAAKWGPLGRGWLDDVRQLAPRTIVAMWLVAAALALFHNYGLFRWSALTSLIEATHGLIGATRVANLIDLAVVVGGVLVAWGHARCRELGLRAGDVPRAVATTLAIWVALNLGAIVADLWVGERIELAAAWRAPARQAGDLAGQLFGNALCEEIVFRHAGVRGPAAPRRALCHGST